MVAFPLPANSKLHEGRRPGQPNSKCHSRTCLLAKQTTDSPQHAVLLRVVRVVFARNLEERWECGSVGIDPVSYPVGNMLVDQHNADVFPLGRESLKCLLDGGGICLGIDDEKVLLRVWGGRDVTYSC